MSSMAANTKAARLEARHCRAGASRTEIRSLYFEIDLLLATTVQSLSLSDALSSEIFPFLIFDALLILLFDVSTFVCRPMWTSYTVNLYTP
jgi:hypothetical protein